MAQRFYTPLVLAAIILLALLLRLVGINWDDYARLHPDERFLNSLVAKIGEERDLTATTRARCPDEDSYYEYFNTSCSVLNPNNVEEGSYAYGTFPLFIVRGAAQYAAEFNFLNLKNPDLWTNYDYIHLIGRGMNALADTLTVFFIFLIGRRLFSTRAGLLAALLYAAAVLPIQLAHFWTVDIMSHLFFVVGLYMAVEISRGQWWAYPLFGLMTGCALASRINLFPMFILLPIAAFIYLEKFRQPSVLPFKWRWSHGAWALVLLLALVMLYLILGLGDVSFPIRATTRIAALTLLPILLLGTLIWHSRSLTSTGDLVTRRWLLRGWLVGLLMALNVLIVLVTFRVLQPYAFAGPEFSNFELNEKWIRDIGEVSNYSRFPNEGWPPSTQWYGRISYAYPWWNMIAWGLGITLGLVATIALIIALIRQVQVRRLSPTLGLLTAWVLVYFALQGSLHQMTMRYYLPLYGTLCLLAAWGLRSLPYQRRYATLMVVIATLLWAFAFHNIYRQPLSRLQASEWIVEHIPGTITLQNDQGEMQSLTLNSGEFRYKLQPGYNGESYLGTPFFIDQNLTLHGFEVRFADTLPTEVVLQIYLENGDGTQTGLTSFTFQTDEHGVARMPTDLLPTLNPGNYRWWILTRWQGEAPIRHFMPISLWQDDEGNERQMAVNFLSPYQPVDYHYFPPDVPINFNIKREFTGTEILIPHMIGTAEELIFTVREQPIRATLIDSSPHMLGETRRYMLEQPLLALPGTVMQVTAPEPLYLTGTTIATDGGWEDSLPWGYCLYREKERPWYQPIPFRDECEDMNAYASGYYIELGLDMARTDDRPKYLRMVDILNKADYLVLSSNRFYDALPRVPERFALSADYYDRLFAGQLNYELLQEVAVFPGFLGLRLRDQVLPTEDLPAWANEFEAEEAFTVYDHPTVYIFRNNGFHPADFPIETVTANDERNRIDLSAVGAATFQHKPAGNLNQMLLLWVGGFILLGWIAYPLMFRLFGSLPLHGFTIGRAVAWLLLALLPWWLTSTTRLPFWTRDTLGSMVILFALLNAYLAYRQRRAMLIYVRHRWQVLLAAEIIFLAVLGFGLLVRAINPDLWHVARGGEKPMDFAYLNATLRTPVFPPPNPWLAGFEINYYYFGFVLAALPIKLGNFAPEVAYNLVMGTLFAVIFMNVFTLTYSLLPSSGQARWRLALALIGVLFVMVMGNLGTLKLMFDPEPNMGADRWYWYPSRVLAESANRAGGAFNEWPLFSFLYGDLHAHTIALIPVTLYLTTLWLLLHLKRWWLGAALGMLAAVIYMTNTWDTILYVPLGALGMWWATRSLRDFARLAVIVGAAGVITVAPYYLHFTLGDNGGVERWREARSLFEPFLLMWGIPVAVVTIWQLYRLKALLVPQASVPVEIGLLILVIFPLLSLSSENATSALCLLFILAGLLLARYDVREYRGVHLGVVLIFAVLLFPEHFVIKNDVGRMNTVFKTAYQVWLWVGLLIPVVLFHLFRRRLYIQGVVCLIFISLGMFFPINAVPARYDDNETGEITLDGSRFMDELVLYNLNRRVVTARDAAMIGWLRENVTGFPVIAEWYQQEYWWHSRVAVQTGFPSVMGWANHMRQQYTHQLPEIEARMRDLQLLYTTTDIQEMRRLLRQYDIEYIIVGELERSVALPETLDIFYTLRDQGELSLVYDAPFTEIYRVEELQEQALVQE